MPLHSSVKRTEEENNLLCSHKPDEITKKNLFRRAQRDLLNKDRSHAASLTFYEKMTSLKTSDLSYEQTQMFQPEFEKS